MVGVALLGGAALLLWLAMRGKDGIKRGVPGDVQLSKNFRLSEFLRSNVMPSLQYYVPSPSELANIKTLVTRVLQPLRDRFGPITVTHGGRPPISTPEGLNFTEALLRAGWKPAKNSDHSRFAAADFTLRKPELLPIAYIALQRNPNVRQVIAYQAPGEGVTRLHVAVAHPSYARLRSKNFAFTKTV